MGSKGSKVEHHYHTTIKHVPDPETLAALDRANAKMEELEKEAAKRKDPAFFSENVGNIFDDHINELKKLKINQSIVRRIPDDMHVGFMGPVTAGKTTYCNTLHGTKRPVALGHCTNTVEIIYSNIDAKEDDKKEDKVGYFVWDVPGANNEFKHFTEENYQFIASLDVCLVMFDSDVSVVSWILRAVHVINPKALVIVRTKVDQCDEDSERTVEEEKILDQNKVFELLGEDYPVYCISSHNISKKRGERFDWDELADVVYPRKFRTVSSSHTASASSS